MFKWITDLIESMGYIGVALLMFLENLVPPIPSELIMPLAGFVASQGGMNHWAVLITGTAGSFAGALLWFYVGRRLGERRLREFVRKHGKWVTLSCHDLDQANDWFRRHGALSVFLGRLIPGVRTFISVPAGVSKMSVAQFSFYTLLGTVLWTAALMFAGHVLRQNFSLVADYIGVISNVVLGLFITMLAYRYFDQWRHRNDETPPEQDCEAETTCLSPSVILHDKQQEGAAMAEAGSYRVQEFAQRAGVSVRTLHHYYRLNLLKPERAQSGYRLYHEHHLERLEQIIALKFMGLPLKDIKRLLEGNAREISNALHAQRLALENKRRLLDLTIQAIAAARRRGAAQKL